MNNVMMRMTAIAAAAAVFATSPAIGYAAETESTFVVSPSPAPAPAPVDNTTPVEVDKTKLPADSGITSAEVTTTKEGTAEIKNLEIPATTANSAVIIPEKVTANGVDYAVTVIKQGTFANAEAADGGDVILSKVSLSGPINTIAKKAFMGLDSLKALEIKPAAALNAEYALIKSTKGFNEAFDKIFTAQKKAFYGVATKKCKTTFQLNIDTSKYTKKQLKKLKKKAAARLKKVMKAAGYKGKIKVTFGDAAPAPAPQPAPAPTPAG